jgi:Nuclear protein Es2
MTPQITPGGGNASPITTWGTIDQTPLVISGRDPAEDSNTTDGGGPVFSMPAYNQQEDAARLAEMELVRRAKRAKQQMTTTPTRATTQSKSSRRKSSLTPAAMSWNGCIRVLILFGVGRTNLSN